MFFLLQTRTWWLLNNGFGYDLQILHIPYVSQNITADSFIGKLVRKQRCSVNNKIEQRDRRAWMKYNSGRSKTE